MAVKKSELYSTLWRSCDELRGGMDPSQYKDYVLVMLFVKYISDKYAGDPHALIEVPDDGSFKAMVALKGDKEIGDKINKIIGRLADVNDLKGVIDVADFNNEDKLGKGKAMVDRLSKLVGIFENPALNFKSNRADGDDLMGDAYEFLMRHFASESGKSKGQFYTPAEVSRVIARVIGLDSASQSSQTIYDPACGSGSLLLKVHDEAQGLTGRDLTIYGQEMDNATAALAKMNMILHNCPTAEVWKDDSLSHPYYKDANGQLKRHDFVVANPPFSTKSWSNGFDPAKDEYQRFGLGTPPEKNGDYAFLLHILASLKSKGKGAVILPHGVLFRGNAEGEIRKKILIRGYIFGIIGLPSNLFFGTGIPACIIVLDKQNAVARKGVFMIDASQGFRKDGNKNRLRAQDMHRIVDTFTKQLETPKYSRLIPIAEIEANDYNLNIARYIDNSEPEDLQDLSAHIHGGIPNRDIDALSSYWEVIPGVRTTLFSDDRPGYCRLNVDPAEIKTTILDHTEFSSFKENVSRHFTKWKAQNLDLLKDISTKDRPKKLIADLSETLLTTFKAVPLLDENDVYQQLMDYWDSTMQDDVYMIVTDGWQATVDGSPNTDLIPAALVEARYFEEQRDALWNLKMSRDAITAQLEEIQEEHATDDGLLANAVNDVGKLTRVSAGRRLKNIMGGPLTGDEWVLLSSFSDLIEKEAEANRNIREAENELAYVVGKKYSDLSNDETKVLVVDDKWLATLFTAVRSEMDRVAEFLTERIHVLSERYAVSLPRLNEQAEMLAALVDSHINRLLVAWNK